MTDLGNFYLWELLGLPASAGPAIVAVAVVAMAVGCFIGARRSSSSSPTRADPLAEAASPAAGRAASCSPVSPRRRSSASPRSRCPPGSAADAAPREAAAIAPQPQLARSACSTRPGRCASWTCGPWRTARRGASPAPSACPAADLPKLGLADASGVARPRARRRRRTSRRLPAAAAALSRARSPSCAAAGARGRRTRSRRRRRPPRERPRPSSTAYRAARGHPLGPDRHEGRPPPPPPPRRVGAAEEEGRRRLQRRRPDAPSTTHMNELDVARHSRSSTRSSTSGAGRSRSTCSSAAWPPGSCSSPRSCTRGRGSAPRAARWLPLVAPLLVSLGMVALFLDLAHKALRVAVLPRVPLDLADVLGRLDPRSSCTRCPSCSASRRCRRTTRRGSRARAWARARLVGAARALALRHARGAPRGDLGDRRRARRLHGRPPLDARRAGAVELGAARARSSSSRASRPAPRSPCSCGSHEEERAFLARADVHAMWLEVALILLFLVGLATGSADGRAAAGPRARRPLHGAVLGAGRHRRAPGAVGDGAARAPPTPARRPSSPRRWCSSAGSPCAGSWSPPDRPDARSGTEQPRGSCAAPAGGV